MLENQKRYIKLAGTIASGLALAISVHLLRDQDHKMADERAKRISDSAHEIGHSIQDFNSIFNGVVQIGDKLVSANSKEQDRIRYREAKAKLQGLIDDLDWAISGAQDVVDNLVAQEQIRRLVSVRAQEITIAVQRLLDTAKQLDLRNTVMVSNVKFDRDRQVEFEEAVRLYEYSDTVNEKLLPIDFALSQEELDFWVQEFYASMAMQGFLAEGEEFAPFEIGEMPNGVVGFINYTGVTYCNQNKAVISSRFKNPHMPKGKWGEDRRLNSPEWPVTAVHESIHRFGRLCTSYLTDSEFFRSAFDSFYNNHIESTAQTLAQEVVAQMALQNPEAAYLFIRERREIVFRALIYAAITENKTAELVDFIRRVDADEPDRILEVEQVDRLFQASLVDPDGIEATYIKFILKIMDEYGAETVREWLSISLDPEHRSTFNLLLYDRSSQHLIQTRIVLNDTFDFFRFETVIRKKINQIYGSRD